MSKYIVTWSENSTQINPYYSSNNRHIESEYMDTTVERNKYLANDKELEEFVISTKTSNMKNIRYHILDKEIYPKLQITMQI
jgi:hypothetical protein